jgi:hypothetical protein
VASAVEARAGAAEAWITLYDDLVADLTVTIGDGPQDALQPVPLEAAVGQPASRSRSSGTGSVSAWGPTVAPPNGRGR